MKILKNLELEISNLEGDPLFFENKIITVKEAFGTLFSFHIAGSVEEADCCYELGKKIWKKDITKLSLDESEIRILTLVINQNHAKLFAYIIAQLDTVVKDISEIKDE